MDDYRTPAAGKCAASMKKSGKLAIALLVAAVGVLLLLIGNRSTAETDTPTPDEPPAGAQSAAVEAYRLALEERMATLCAEVSGVGHVRVAVTLAGGYEYVYACDRKTTAGGESTTYITVGSGAGESLVYITERAPAITGIGVVCDGGMDETVRRELINLLSATYGVGANKIYITARK